MFLLAQEQAAEGSGEGREAALSPVPAWPCSLPLLLWASPVLLQGHHSDALPTAAAQLLWRSGRAAVLSITLSQLSYRP